MSKIQEKIRAIKEKNRLIEANLWRIENDYPLLEHVVAMKKGSIDNIEHRRNRLRWLIGKLGVRSERWDMIMRSEGGTTYLFRDRDDAIMFKMIWAGEGENGTL